jgi:hypothetical protein
MLRLPVLFSLALFSLSTPALAAASSGGGEGVQCDCSSGKPKCKIGGQDATVNMGSATPTKQGTIPKMEQCQGTAFACMKGKDCITIEGGIKFHKTNCGSGGGTPQGKVSTAGCVELADADFDKIKGMQGQKFDIKGCGGKGGR